MADLFTNAHALLIGVGADLPVTVNDASTIGNHLTDPSKAAYDPNNVSILTEKNATRGNILTSLDELISKTDENSKVIVYYSGHGATKDDKYYLVPNNYFEEKTYDALIKAEEFSEKIASIQSKKLIVLLDCCHSQGMSKGDVLDVPAITPVSKHVTSLTDKLDDGTGKIIFSSSRNEELSYIMPNDPNSLFTLTLIEAMDGKASSEGSGSYVNILEVLSYVFDQVPKRSQDKQHPFINKIENLSDNFSLCYLPQMIRKSLPTDAPSIDLTSVHLELTGLKSNAELLVEKITFLKQQAIMQVDPNMKFMLDKQLLELNKEHQNMLARITDLTKRVGG